MASWTVRPVEPGDRAAWLRMRRSLWPEGSEAEHAAEIDTYLSGRELPPPGLREVLILLASGRPVGFLELSVREYVEGGEGPTPFIEGWYVEPGYRGAGGGRALVEAAERWAVAGGFPEIASDALVENDVSLHAHRALGFREVERIVVFRKRLPR